MSGPSYYTDNLSHIQGALLGLNLRLHRQVLRWRATHHAQATPDELAGLHMSENEADAVLDELYRASAPPEADPVDRAPIATITNLLMSVEEQHASQEADAIERGIVLRLPELIRRFGLEEFEAQVLLMALAPEMNRVYQRLFKYLNDDVTRPWPSVDLAIQLFGCDMRERMMLLRYFAPDAALRQSCLIRLSEESTPLEQPLLSRSMKLDDRVAGYVLEIESPDPALEQVLEFREPPIIAPVLPPESERQAKLLHARLSQGSSQVPAVAIVGTDVDTGVDVAAWLAASARPQVPILVVDSAVFANLETPEDIADRILREARLGEAPLVVRDAGQIAHNSRHGRALQRLLAAGPAIPRFLIFREEPAEISSGDSPIVALKLSSPDFFTRRRLWESQLNGAAPEADLNELASRFRLTNREIVQAANQAFAHSDAFGDSSGPDMSDLFAASRARSTGALTGLAERVESIHTWDDLVLPPAVKSQLLSLEHWVRYRYVVYDTWGFSDRVMLGRGLVVLFSGASGTGKTMAAGILARNLDLDLYRIDLSHVVSKYIGETEKNLGRIFDAAQSANAVLFFDEADALFGKRSEVKDAHDRYANIEVSYLLQRMEAYDGIAILCTNFRQNLDQAFARRLHMIVELPQPSVADRERIWRLLLPETVPQDHELELGFLARQFSLTGGNIKNCVLTAAFQAAADDSPIAMRHLVMAIARELQKTEQPLVRSDFGRYYDVVRALGTR